MSSRDEYLKWRRQSAVGCVFARLMAAHSDRFGQKIEEIRIRVGTPMKIAGAIAARVDRLVTDPAISAATILLPRIDTLESLLAVTLALRSYPKWTVTTAMIQAPPPEDLVAVRVVREIPFGEQMCPSEALILGPFEGFPPTRQAPITVIELFVGLPMPIDPKNHQPTTKANLAHVDLGPDFTQELIDNMWERSIEGRTRSLGGEDNRAKAKVSFVVPRSFARDSGCEPS
jgi:hypothetical protein